MISRNVYRLARFFSTSSSEYQGISFDLIKQQTMERDLEALKKQILFRCGNLGMKELDIIVGQWSKQNIPKFSQKECEEFSQEILTIETPSLLKYIMGSEQPQRDLKFLKSIQNFAFNSKKDYNSN